VDTVTIGELLMMIARLKEDGTLHAKPLAAANRPACSTATFQNCRTVP